MWKEPHLRFAWQDAEAKVENRSGVLLMLPKSGEPYLARTNVLKRRVTRLGRVFDLGALEAEFCIWYTPSKLEQSLVFYQVAKEHFPETYRKIVRLPSPAYIKVLLGNEFPRTVVTSRLAGRESIFFGPFRTRAEAERYEGQVLDFFPVRRCEEDLSPNPDHPGCIYGEMNQCLRPCQLVVGPVEYATEVKKLTSFLETQGESLKDAVSHARERASQNLEFEEAARQHRRLEKVEAVARSASEITGDIRQANGVSAVKSDKGVDLYFLLEGIWQEPVEFELVSKAGESMDRRLRQLVDELPPVKPTLKEREEHLGLLQRWFFSTWRDSDWLPFPSRAEVPYRKLVRMISRAAGGGAKMEGNDVASDSPIQPNTQPHP